MAVKRVRVRGGTAVAHEEGTKASTFKVGDGGAAEMVLGNGQITSANGSISFDNENLSGTGTWNISSGTMIVPTPTSSNHAATKGYVDSTFSGVSNNKGSVLAYQSSPPSSPSDGDKYLVKATGTGDWSGHDNEIATYNTSTSSWSFSGSPSEGWMVFNKDDSDNTYGNRQLINTDSGWEVFSNVVHHNNLADLDTGSDYLHLNSTQKSALTGGSTTDADAQHTHDTLMKKPTTQGTENNFVSFDANGNAKDSTYSASDFASSTHNHDTEYISIISSPTAGNLVKQDANGEVVDTGHDETYYLDADNHVVDTANLDKWLNGVSGDVQSMIEKIDEIDAADIPVDTTNFDNNLSASDNTVQKALETLDDLATSSTAAGTSTDTTNFDGVLSSADDNVQKALDTLDDHTHSTFSGAVTHAAQSIANTDADLGSVYTDKGSFNVTASTANVTITLPALSSNYGKELTFTLATQSGSYYLDVQCAGSDTYIDGSSTNARLSSARDIIRVFATAAGWDFEGTGMSMS